LTTGLGIWFYLELGKLVFWSHFALQLASESFGEYAVNETWLQSKESLVGLGGDTSNMIVFPSASMDWMLY
jgi:hypothetical protein